VFREGLKAAPDDSSLKAALRIARVNYANQLNERRGTKRPSPTSATC
jgi:hypothetical protein